MQLYILNPNYDFVGMIDQTESTLWNKKYNDDGYCEIYVPCDMDMIELLRKGNYVYRYDDEMFCKIEGLEIDTDAENGDYIISTANDIAKIILSGRIVRWQVVYKGTVFGFLQKVITDNIINPAQSQRKISNFVFDTSNAAEFTETIEVSTFAEDLHSLVKNTCKTYNYGYRISYTPETQSLVFRLFKGVNRADPTQDGYVEFSPAFSNILASKYKEDDSNYKNVAYVGYKAADETVHLLSLYNGDTEPTGEDRKEVFADGSNTSRDITYEELLLLFPSVRKVSSTVTTDGKTQIEAVYYSGDTEVATSVQEVKEGEETEEKITVTDYTYLLLIRALGDNTLAGHKKTQTFGGEIDTTDTYIIKQDYDIGDIVKVKDRYGNEADARIVEIMESEDNEDGRVVEPIFEYST